MPVVHPAELWQETGRYDKIGPELARFKDRGGRDMVLAMTHEEVVADLLRDIVQQLPPAADDRLPLPDQVPRRAARPRRPDPRARVRHEGLLLAATSTRPGWTPATTSTTRPTPASSSASGSTRSRWRPTSGMMGGTQAHEFMVAQRASARTRWSCATPAASRQPADRARRRRRAAARGAAAARGRRDARRDDHRTRWPRSSASARSGPPRPTFFVTGDGRLITAIVRGDSTSTRRSSPTPCRRATACARHRRGDPARGHGARLRLAASAPTTRSSWSTSWSPRSPNLVAGANRRRLAPAERQRRPRLHAGPRRRHRQRPRGRRLPELRRAGAAWPRASRSATSSSSARTTPTRWARPTWARTAAPPDRHGLLRHRPRARAGLHRRGAPRRRRASSGPRRWRPTRPTSSPSAPEQDPHGGSRWPKRLTPAPPAAGREILYDDRDESPGVKFTDAELLGMPWISPSAASLAAGGVEVTERATGERSTRPIEDVEAFLTAPR